MVSPQLSRGDARPEAGEREREKAGSAAIERVERERNHEFNGLPTLVVGVEPRKKKFYGRANSALHLSSQLAKPHWGDRISLFRDLGT